LARGGVTGAPGLPAEHRVHLTIDVWIDLTFVFFSLRGQLHGRTRQQRYQKLADWDYIRECVAAVREKEEDSGCEYSYPLSSGSPVVLRLSYCCGPLLPGGLERSTDLRRFSPNPAVPPVPIFGGGDAFSSQDYWEKVEYSGVDGVMIARGALIKPWIFREIKERREWDISSRERLELIRQVSQFNRLTSNWHPGGEVPKFAD